MSDSKSHPTPAPGTPGSRLTPTHLALVPSRKGAQDLSNWPYSSNTSSDQHPHPHAYHNDNLPPVSQTPAYRKWTKILGRALRRFWRWC